MDKNPQLETAIIQNPEDREAWAVYADWLQSRSLPRGELIALELALDTTPEKPTLLARRAEMIRKYDELWMGEELKALTESNGGNPDVLFKWRFGFIHTARVRSNDSDHTIQEVLEILLDSDSCRFLRELNIESMGSYTYIDSCMKVLEKRGPLPGIHRLYLGYKRAGPSGGAGKFETPNLLAGALPDLELLKVNQARIQGKIQYHPKLREIYVSMGGEYSFIETIVGAKLPRLKVMELWFDTGRHFAATHTRGFGKIADAAGLPALRTLRFRRCQYAGEIIEALLGSQLLQQLETLDVVTSHFHSESERDNLQTLYEYSEQLKHLKTIYLRRESLELVPELMDALGERLRFY